MFEVISDENYKCYNSVITDGTIREEKGDSDACQTNKPFNVQLQINVKIQSKVVTLPGGFAIGDYPSAFPFQAKTYACILPMISSITCGDINNFGIATEEYPAMRYVMST